jgi:hypothetical protein
MQIFYHINQNNEIVSGPYLEQSTYIKNLTSCGNPECLNLIEYGLRPLIQPTISNVQRFKDEIVVFPDHVENIVEDIPLVELKATQKSIIKDSFLRAEFLGYETSFGFKIDCDRGALQNIQCLILLMESTNLTDTQFRDFNNNLQAITFEQLQQLYFELITNFNNLYQQKWAKEAEINACTTATDVILIIW